METRTPVVGVIMAGGAGERMRRSGESRPKPMVPVLGAPLVERNLLALIRSGVEDVTVVVAASGAAAPLVTQWAEDRGRLLAAASGGRLRVLVEPEPMGNAGALRLVGSADRSLLLLFADNLTALDLSWLVEAHVRTRADISLAVHEQRFPLPYGVVEHDGGVVTGYREKPVMAVTVGSGVAVVGPGAQATLASARGPVGIVDLVRRAIDARLAVRAVEHRAPWVDVNDAPSLEQAAAIVRANPDAFELCWPDLVQQKRLPGEGGVRVRIDDVDAEGRPCRVEVPETAGPDALEAVKALGAGAAARVSAWLS